VELAVTPVTHLSEFIWILPLLGELIVAPVVDTDVAFAAGMYAPVVPLVVPEFTAFVISKALVDTLLMVP